MNRHLSSIVDELSQSCEVLAEEKISIAQVQARAIVADAPSRGGSRSSRRSRGGQSAPFNASIVEPAGRRANTTIGSVHEGSKNKRALLSRAEAEKIFQELDANRDGEISQIEFIKAMRKNTSLAERLGLKHIKQHDGSIAM